jgi:hypothetical protein
MSYRRESPCINYYEKTKGDGLLRKSLSATRVRHTNHFRFLIAISQEFL